MKLTTFQKLATHKGRPRLWLESQRLNTLGFTAGTSLAVSSQGYRLTILPSPTITANTVSERRAAGNVRPIIDLNSSETLSAIADYAEVRIRASYNRIEVAPSVRAAYIHRRLHAPSIRALELFAGGSLLGKALPDEVQLVAAVEMEPDYADVCAKQHPETELIQSNIRLIHPSELPDAELWLVGIPCTSHSQMGRAKKNLAGKPELGDTGDLYMSVASLIAARLPLVVVAENVPSFATSLAGLSLVDHLRKLGYHVSEHIIEPHEQWGEPQDRRRWVMVATLVPGFEIVPPMTPFTGDLRDYLDPPDPTLDRADAERIAKTVECLRKHNKRHQDMGHGFGFTTINHDSKKVPTLVRSYHKINVGPFVECDGGLRMLRKAEAERLMGCEIQCDHYATAIQVLFQGVQTRVFRQILQQLYNFLLLAKLR